MLSGDVTGRGGFDPAVAATVARLSGVEAVLGVRFLDADVAGAPTFMVSVDPATVLDPFDLGEVRGRIEDLDVDGIALHVDAAAGLGVDVGDEVLLRFAATGEQVFEVAVIYGDATLAGRSFIGHEAHDANLDTALDSSLYVALAPAADVDEVREDVASAVAAHPRAEVVDRSGFAAEQGRRIDQVLVVVYALFSLAVLIAVVGIANNVSLSVSERTREIGLLRAVGILRSQVAAAVTIEACIVSALGAGVGVALGAGFADAFLARLTTSRWWCR